MLKFNIKNLNMKSLLIPTFVLSFFAPIVAQQDEQMSLYMYNPLYFNAAYAGSRDAISTVALARFQWVNFKGSPMTQWFSVHSPILHKSIGVGGHVVNDQIGSRSRLAAYGDLSSSIKLNKKEDRLAAGINFGFDALSFDFQNANVNDINDPWTSSSFSVTKPNIGAGLFYYGKKHYLGISVPRLFESTIPDAQDVLQTVISRHFFIQAGYVFDLNSVFKLKPSTLVKYTPNAPITFDANLSLLMFDKLWTGIMYRYNESAGINIVYNIKQTLQIGYVYDFPINGLRNYQSGSHEMVIQYDIKSKKSAYTSPRYF